MAVTDADRKFAYDVYHAGKKERLQLIVALRERIERDTLTVAVKHRILKSDLVGYLGRCSCQKEGEFPVDFETEEDWIRHVIDALGACDARPSTKVKS